MKVLLLLLLATASAVFGKSLPESNLLLAEDGTAHFNIDQPNFDWHFSRTTDDFVESGDNTLESEQGVIGESTEADVAASHENDEGEPSSVEHEGDDLVESDDNVSEAGQNVIEESNEVDLVASPEIAEDESSPIEHEEEDDHLLSSDEWFQRMRDDYDWIVKNRLRDSEEQGYYGDRNGFDYPRYDYNPSSSWWLGQKGPIVVQPIVIPVQFAIGQQDYYRRRFMY